MQSLQHAIMQFLCNETPPQRMSNDRAVERFTRPRGRFLEAPYLPALKPKISLLAIFFEF